MKIGLIMKVEKYWSLQKISERVLNCLEKNYEVMTLRFENHSIENQKELDGLYEKCDAVIYIASKLITFKRKYDKPTFFFTYAWMDHGAGINFYINKKTFKNNDSLLFASSAARNKFNQAYSTNIKRAIVPFFVNDQKINLVRDEKKRLRRKYKIPEDADILLYFGRFFPEKNIEALFEIAKKLKHNNFVILVVGEFTDDSTFGFGETETGVYKEKIERMMAAEKSGKIIFTGRIDGDELFNLIAIAFLVINPTICMGENFGLAAVESMSVGVPVVASNWGGLKDIIRSRRDGFLMRTFFSKNGQVELDISAGVDYIDKLLSRKISRENLSRSVLERYQSRFSGKAFLKNIKALLVGLKKKKSLEKQAFIYPKTKYLLAYKSALKRGGVKTIYLDNPWLFRELYKNYLGDK